MKITPKDKKILFDYLSTQRLMSLAVYGKIPWIASIYFICDNDLNFYFLAQPTTEHSKIILDNKEVACAIADCHQMPGDKKIGVQIYGHAFEEGVLSRIEWMFKIYNKLFPDVKDKLNFKNYQTQVITSKVYKIVPKKIKFFNQVLYPDTNEKVFEI